MNDQELLARLDAVAQERELPDPAHDHAHVRRVAATARALAIDEGADRFVCEAAATLHELFSYPKSHPESARSGEVCAEHAREVLAKAGCDAARTDAVAYAIRVHPFSLGIVPETVEAKILQDADRLDAIGAIGVARCFATCAEMKRPFYAPDDPFCRERAPDDKLWGIDHFYRKLLRVGDGLHTRGARAIAAERTAFMRAFLDELAIEISDSRAGKGSTR